MSTVLDFILGRKLASGEQKAQKIGFFSALPALGLDGLSSSAYGPEAALTILLPLGAAGLAYIGPIMLMIVLLLTMLYFSYRQTIAAYPVNGGSYTVAKENLGTWPSLLAAAALMIDYVLTVAVGISAGVAALVSAVPHLYPYTLTFCIAILIVITLLNLRGTLEAGIVFALPTYLFIATMAVVLILGIIRSATSQGHPLAVIPPPSVPTATMSIGIWLFLRSFASGCTAMTGVEAVSNGVSAFKEPTVKNAQYTLTWIVLLLAILLAGIAYLCHTYQIAAMDQQKAGYQSVLSQLTCAVVGRGWFYHLTIVGILAVLSLSANTSFVDFPRLCRLIARDGFLPIGFATVGRRLVYSVGILFLALCAGLLLFAFNGITDKLIPLFAVGAFLAFTLSQSGMVIHWRKALRTQQATPDTGGRKTMRLKLAVNAMGALATAAALAIIISAKFIEGAWITILAIPVLLTLFKMTQRHYKLLEKQLKCTGPLDLSNYQQPIVLVPIRGWDNPTSKSLRFGMHLSKDIIAIHLTNLEGDQATSETSKLRRIWAQEVEQPATAAGMPPPKLEMVHTPYREFVTPIMERIDKFKTEYPQRPVAVIIPDIIEKHWWQSILHSSRASDLRSALRSRSDLRVVVIDLPWFV
jgi:amino acid transporter